MHGLDDAPHLLHARERDVRYDCAPEPKWEYLIRNRDEWAYGHEWEYSRASSKQRAPEGVNKWAVSEKREDATHKSCLVAVAYAFSTFSSSASNE
jgi:hypothetical protein